MTTGRGDQPPEEAVFVRDSTDIDHPLDGVKSFLSDRERLGPLARAAVGEAELWLSLMAGQPRGAGEVRVPPVHVRLGPWRADGLAHVVELRWETPAAVAMLPLLDGSMALAPLGTEQCRLTLDASYRALPVRTRLVPDAASLKRAGESA